jgi:hypothetical protein
MNCNNGDLVNAQPSLGMHYKSFHFFSFLIFQVIFIIYINKYYVIYFPSLALSSVYSWLCLLFTNYVITFVTMKRRKQCLPLRFIFQDNVNIIAYLTMDHHKSSKTRRNWLYFQELHCLRLHKVILSFMIRL